MSTHGGIAAQSGQETPNDRATTFQAVQGNQGEQYSGGVLLVSAYAALWIVIFAWLALVWRKQSALTARLEGLERVLDKAAAQSHPSDPSDARETRGTGDKASN
jgi:hypothetical protein